jgi:hypothetical protein
LTESETFLSAKFADEHAHDPRQTIFQIEGAVYVLSQNNTEFAEGAGH